MKQIWNFSEMDFIYDRFNPLTPYGKNEKDKRIFFHSKLVLEKEYDLTEEFVSFIKKDKFAVSKIEYHLKNIPLLICSSGKKSACFNASDIFLVKKFLYNSKAVIGFLPSKIRKTLKINWKSEELYKTLKKGGGDGETFYLSENYSGELKTIRRKIKKQNDLTQKIKDRKINIINKKYGIDFRFKDFIVAGEKEVNKIYNEKDFFVDSYDGKHSVLKPVFGKEYFAAVLEKEKLISLEKEIEQKVLKQISNEIQKKHKEISECINFIKNTDIFLAKARLAVNFKLTRPKFANYGKNIKIKKAYFLPLSVHLKSENTKYTPLSCEFKNRIAVIRGSNMGGKTVVLKTLSFLQLLSQMGFFAPAEKFETVLFENINWIGSYPLEESAGLSSFGVEIVSLINSCKNKNKKTLFIIDEFARTTNVLEAEALASAVTTSFSENKNTYALFSTHLADIKRVKNLSFYKMKGFDSVAFKTHTAKKKIKSTANGLKEINKFMRFVLTEDKKRFSAYDAVSVAEILGLDKNIIKTANCFMKRRNSKPHKV